MVKPLKRTVQYWVLTDGRYRTPVESVDWPAALSHIAATRPVVELDGEDVQGIVENFADGTVGLALSKRRDHVPKQGDFSSGTRATVGIRQGWSAIDDTFVYFCGPMNVVATLAETQQSMRIRKVAEWLQAAIGPPADDPEFFWTYDPLVDTLRRQQIDSMTGIRMAHLAGSFGRNRGTSPGVIRQLLGGRINEDHVDGITVEVTIKRTHGGGGPADDRAILDFMTEAFGPLEADTQPATEGYEKFDIKPTESSTEIDLISQRLTRKADVQLPVGPSQAVFADSAFDALRGASAADEEAIRVALETMFDLE